MATIMIVEDDRQTNDAVSEYLKSFGHRMLSAYDGDEALQLFECSSIDLIILDIMLPGEDGMAILKRLKASGQTREIPVIMATARSSEFDKVYGLDSGADDYVAKPFGMMELLARVKAVLRRARPQEAVQTLSRGAILLDTDKHVVRVQGTEVYLTYKEFELLRILMTHPGQVFSRDRLLAEIWGYDFDGETRTVDVHIRSLRHKLGAAGEEIETVRGIGYRMRDEK